METGQAEAAEAEAVGQIAVSLKAGLRVCGSDVYVATTTSGKCLTTNTVSHMLLQPTPVVGFSRFIGRLHRRG